ncbi:MAG: bacillithiol biosynthesis cysteine-adding enzyme BshC [Ignavibacteriales bacterium]|nr:bacillithiol biosynthesis cysteine-adding enzyme BshC [Ignavibacteriales bacterium]
MNTTIWIDINDLPKIENVYSQLFRDYINDFSKVNRYFQHDFNSLNTLNNLAENIQKRCVHRQLLVDVLMDQNNLFGASQATFDNIKSLGDNNTFAVVTGQQVGLFTGPLYTLYKTITAIKLVKRLNDLYPQYKFVPVFWLEGEDHDFEEVNHINLINNEQLISKIEYTPSSKIGNKNSGPAGEILIENNINEFFQSIRNIISNTEFKAPMIEMLMKCYSEQTSFNQAFASLMNKFFGEDGLVFISSYNKDFKKLLSPIFQKEITEYPKVSQLIIEQSAELEERYHAQIKTKALNLFYFYKHGRYFIEPRENDFSLRGTRHFISKEDMQKIAVEYPELLSPNVALRPICQDLILPTFAYVAGPSEIAYFAQLKKVYNYFDIQMPVIYPRSSATIIEEKFERIMEKYQIGLLDFFGNPSKINTTVIDFISEVKIDEMFKEASEKLNNLTSEMKFGLNYIDPTLLGALETMKEKIEQQMELLRGKISEAQQRKHETALRQVSKVINNIFPNQNFQERELNIIYFLNKHGSDFVTALKNELAIGKFKHQIIKV